MESIDQTLYQTIGNMLLKATPSDAVKSIVHFTVDSEENENEGAVYDYKYDYIDNNGKRHWFDIAGPDGHWIIGNSFLELRNFFVSQGQPAWRQCEFSVDVKTGKFSVDFKYD
jgi:hypothetical protein